jgi:hypothetical protein
MVICFWSLTNPKRSKRQTSQTFQTPNGIYNAIVFSLHFFVLIQRNEAKKNQGKPDRSARFA